MLRAEHEFVSIGHVAEMLQRSVSAIEDVCSDVIAPEFALNGVLYFAASQVDDIAEMFRRMEESASAANSQGD